MKRCFVFLSAFVFVALASSPANSQLKFKKQIVAAESAESVGVFDVNGDHVLDIVSGGFWYEGPDYLERHMIGQIKREGEYFDDFSTIPIDVNGDGKMDFITGGWFGKTLRWRENPGNDKEWALHDIAVTGNIECSQAWDVDGDGFEEIVPNTPGEPLAYYTLLRDKDKKATGQFGKTQIADKQGHGIGFGDLNGDGRGDFIVTGGWYEAPQNRERDSWKFHNDFDIGDDASVPVIVADVNKDGLNDVIAGHGHSYGLNWFEQKKNGNKTEFIKHTIDPFHSQYHAMAWVDIDNDGEMELVTGKRYRAHNGRDPGGNDPLQLCYFKWNGESFTKNFISYGPFGVGKGTGLYFAVTDLNNNGWKDIVVAGKDGLFIFYNEGK